ncbi:MAG: hypothetical protein OXN97_14930 [Bryobacterales bacterium]|nr:hypothetical protein [Bryobacterales bacterium]
MGIKLVGVLRFAEVDPFFGHDGFVSVETGGHVLKQPDYDPIGTARPRFERMSSAFEKAGLPGP